MSDFKKILKLTWKRLSIWLILLFLFFTLVNALASRNQIKVKYDNLTRTVKTMEKDLGVKESKSPGEKISPEYLTYSKELSKQFAKKYDLEDYIGEEGYENANQWDKIQKSGAEDKYFTLRDFSYLSGKFDGERFSTMEIYEGLIPIIILMLGIFTIITTSVEESMGYYDFTMMLPWKKEKELLMKIGQGFLFALIVFIINLIVTSLLLKSSAFGNVLSFQGLGVFLLKSLMVFLIGSTITTSTGIVAGNVLGHIGLMNISIFGLELIRNLLVGLISVFSLGLAENFNQLTESFKEATASHLRVFLSISYADFDNIKSLLVALVYALIIGGIAYLVTKNSSAERSGFMVKNKTINAIAKVLAVFSLTSLLYSFSISIFEVDFLIIRLVMYGLSFLLSYKFFDILFSIRLKF